MHNLHYQWDKFSELRIFDRPVRQAFIAVVNPRELIGLARIFLLIKHPVRFLKYYLWFQTEPKKHFKNEVEIRTPLGLIKIKTRTCHDYVTIFEIFCRRDYRLRKGEKNIIDVGSNIGISAIYFLSRNIETKVICFEPNPENLFYFYLNLESFVTRLEVHPVALGSNEGTHPFTIERTGRYGSLKIEDEDSAKFLYVPVWEIVGQIQKAIANYGSVQVVKIDTEGTELELLEILLKSQLGGFRVMAENNLGGVTNVFLK